MPPRRLFLSALAALALLVGLLALPEAARATDPATLTWASSWSNQLGIEPDEAMERGAQFSSLQAKVTDPTKLARFELEVATGDQVTLAAGGQTNDGKPMMVVKHPSSSKSVKLVVTDEAKLRKAKSQ
jgi:hypothetical protein